MKIQIHDSRPALTVLDIQKLEEKLDISLPSDYRSFLLSYNGGKPDPAAFPLPENPVDTHAMVDWFYCIHDGDPYDLETFLNIMTTRIPNGLLPIAIDPGGNQICIQVVGDERGKIYFWDHEEEPFHDPQDYDGTLLIANNFSEFLDSFTELPE